MVSEGSQTEDKGAKSPPKDYLPLDEFDNLRSEEAKARVIRVKQQPPDEFLLDEREKAAIELVNCNLARALSITEEEKSDLIRQMTSLRARLGEKEKSVAEIEKRRQILQTSVDLMKVSRAHAGKNQAA